MQFNHLTPIRKPWVIQSFRTFHSMNRTLIRVTCIGVRGGGAGGGCSPPQLRKYSGKTLGIRAKEPGIRYILIQIFIFILSPASTTRPNGPCFKLLNGFAADLPLVST